MSKTFEDLVRDANVATFIKDTQIIEDKPKIIICEPVSVPTNYSVPPQDAPSREIRTKFGSKVAMTGEQLDERKDIIEKRGEFRQLMTEAEHEKDVLHTEAKQESDMWTNVSLEFGDLLNFKGSPFLVAGKTDEQLKDSVEKAEEYLELVLGSEKVLEREQIVEIKEEVVNEIRK